MASAWKLQAWDPARLIATVFNGSISRQITVPVRALDSTGSLLSFLSERTDKIDNPPVDEPPPVPKIDPSTLVGQDIPAAAVASASLAQSSPLDAKSGGTQ